MKARRELLKKVQEDIKAAGQARQRKGTDPEKNAAQRPTTVRDEERDVYYCPQGHEMPFERTKPDERPHMAATTFAILNSVMNFRRFLLRGLEKVKTEWTWAATGFNLKELVRELGRMRAEFAELIAATEG